MEVGTKGGGMARQTLATAYRPYPTPVVTVAMMNQSRQSRRGGLAIY